VPTTTRDPARDANLAAWKVFKQWKKPFLTTFSNRDPITRGGELRWQEEVPGARNLDHVKIRDAGHFLQEDKGPELARVLIDFVGVNPGRA
jgi:haloalkane dehalogenase